MASNAAEHDPFEIGVYDIDSEASTIEWMVKKGFAISIRGKFLTCSGSVVIEPEKYSVSAVVASDSFSSGIMGLTKRMLEPNMLDVKVFPKMTFQSREWTQKGSKATVSGAMEICGATADAIFVVTPEKVEKDCIHLRCQTEIDRANFPGICSKIPYVVVGRQITGTLNIVARRRQERKLQDFDGRPLKVMQGNEVIVRNV